MVVTYRALFVAAAFVSCAERATPLRAPERLLGTDDAVHELPPQGPEYTVLIFFSVDCHVLAIHDDRIRKIAAEYAARGVRFFAVDPEVGATMARDRVEAARRGYPFPILIDGGARTARAFGAEFAGHAVVLDRSGKVLYRGGIDSDRAHLTGGVTPFLADALADLLAGRSPKVAESKALGCALRTW